MNYKNCWLALLLTMAAVFSLSAVTWADITQAVVFDGNSLTAGYESNLGEGRYPSGTDYPSDTVIALGSTLWKGWNTGTDGIAFVGGHATPALTARAPAIVDAKLAGYATKVVVCWEGTDDIQYNSNGALGYGATAYTDAVAYCQARHAAGEKVVIVTIIARNGNVPANFEANRQKYNSLIRANWRSFADALADVGNDNRLGQPGDYANMRYFNVDQFHLTDAGYAIVSQYVVPAVLQAATTSTAAVGRGRTLE